MKPIIYPYKLGSHSARALADGLHTLCVREAGTYKPKQNHLIINWGNPRVPRWAPVTGGILNSFAAEGLAVAQDKLRTFQVFKMREVPCPEWTTDINQAAKWLKAGSAVIQRNLLNSHSGKGIVFIGYDEETSTPIGVLSRAPLYTRYKKKAQEFRVHVVKGQVIDVQEKRKIIDFQGEYNQYVRNHANGWVFAREDIVEPKELRSIAVNAVKALGLDFGAADIIYNKKEDQCFVLEINTAPGLEGQTLTNYVRVFQELCQ